jgi:cyclophilin family peptidyl-prolyl cis-trans isomerase
MKSSSLCLVLISLFATSASALVAPREVTIALNQDTDGDGLVDLNDQDDDNDGILDAVEGTANTDTDADGLPNSADTDSDGDGIYDYGEARALTTADRAALDPDGNGTINGAVGTDGVPNAVQAADKLNSGEVNYVPLNTDGDVLPDFLDIDSDADGLKDVREVGLRDANNDGRADFPVRRLNAFAVNLNFLDPNFDETDHLVQFRPTSQKQWILLGSAGPRNNNSGLPEVYELSFPMNLTLGNYQFEFRVGAKKGGSTKWSTATRVGADAFSAPRLKLCEAASPFSLRLAWDENSLQETGHQVQFKLSSATAWEVYGTAPGNGVGVYSLTSYSLADGKDALSPGQTYNFRILPVRQPPGTPAPTLLQGPESNVMTVTLPAMPAPTNFRTLNRTDTTVSFAWTDNSRWDTGTAIQIREKGNLFSSWDLVYRVDFPDARNSGPITSLEAGKTYEARLVQFINFSNGPLLGPWTWKDGDAGAPLEFTTRNIVRSAPGTEATVGSAFSHKFDITNNEAVASGTVTGMPSWMSFDTTTQTLSGAAPSVGVYPVEYRARFADGFTTTQRFFVRARFAKQKPTLVTPLGTDSLAVNAPSKDYTISGRFSDPETTQVLRVQLSAYPEGGNPRNVDFVLYPEATPATVTNFMAYVNSGRFVNTLFHRSPTGFVVQGGGFRFTSDTATSNPIFEKVTTDAPVVNEPGLPNIDGTLSMAKLGNDENSATNQFFVSLDNNSRSSATAVYPNGLDFQNGGFTVFGRVADDNLADFKAFNSLPKSTVTAAVGGFNTDFQDMPHNTVSGSTTLPNPLTGNEFIRVLSVAPLTELLTYSIDTNSNPTVANASIINGVLTVTPLAGGTTQITVRCTDVDGQFETDTLSITVPQPFSLAAAVPPGSHATQQDLLSYVLGNGNLNTGDSLFAPVVNESGKLEVSFSLNRAAQADYIVSVEASNEPQRTWQTIWDSKSGLPKHPQLVRLEEVNGQKTEVTVQDTQNVTDAERRFLRLKVEPRP